MAVVGGSIEELAAEARERAADVDPADVNVISAQELRDTVDAEPDWLVPGLLARGWALMVSAREKQGKGTFISWLIGKMESGEDTPFGLGVENTVTTLTYTEEPKDSIREKAVDSKITKSEYVFAWDIPKEVRSLPAKDGRRWHALVDCLIGVCKLRGHDVLFIDNVSRAAGVEDEAGIEMSRRVEYAGERCKSAGITLIVDHHHRKSGGSMRDRSRGGTGSVGAVDVALSMAPKTDDESDRRRILSCIGRRKACMWSKVVELNAEGTEYAVLEDSEDPDTDRKGHGAGSLESSRFGALRRACHERNEAEGEPWMTGSEIAAVWGVTASQAKSYLREHPACVIEGPNRGQAKTYAATNWAEPGDAVDRPDY